MLAVAALVAFAIALILHLTGDAARIVTDAVLIGFVLIAAHMAFGWPALPRRRSE